MRSRLMGLAVLAIAAGTLAFAQQGAGRRVTVEKQVRGPERMDQLLNLSEEQETKIRKLRTELRKEQVQHRSKVELARIDLRELLDADAPDRSAIEKKYREISDLQLKQRMAMFDHRMEFEKLLTPEQKKIWKENRGDAGREIRQRLMRRPLRGAGFGQGSGYGPGFGWTEEADEERDVLIFIEEEED